MCGGHGQKCMKDDSIVIDMIRISEVTLGKEKKLVKLWWNI